MKRYLINIISRYYQIVRIKVFNKLSLNKKVKGSPIINQPVLFLGKGIIKFKSNVNIGYFPSPYFYSGNSHFEARTEEANIVIGENVIINNNFVVISESSISIGDNTLIGTNVEIYDSDFHSIYPNRRGETKHEKSPVIIKENVWLGSNVKVLKGVKIGENSVISNGAIVSKDIPANVVAGGIPARVIKTLDEK